MKKHQLMNLTFIFFAALLLSGCKKSIEETTEIATEESKKSKMAKAKQSDPKKNECQLTFGYDHGGIPNYFHYNSMGLVDEWRVDLPQNQFIITIAYDNNNRISTANFLDNGTPIGIEFVWAGDIITREHWDVGGFFQFDVINTYDKHGNIIKKETSYGLYSITEFTPQGNHLRDVVYFGDEVLASDDYTYNQPNKNPFMAIPGLPYAFLYVNPYQSKWYATSDKFTVYENGNPVVLLDTDPAQTVMEFGFRHYLSSVTYYDRVSETFMTRNFEYQNCGPQNNMRKKANGSSNFSTDKKVNRHGPMLIISHDKMRKQIEKLRKQKGR
jgi:hypothetical protein